MSTLELSLEKQQVLKLYSNALGASIVSFFAVQLKTFEESVEREQQMTAELCHRHAEEVNQMKREIREQFNAERERLLNQIRELTVMKENTSAEVRMCGLTSCHAQFAILFGVLLVGGQPTRFPHHSFQILHLILDSTRF